MKKLEDCPPFAYYPRQAKHDHILFHGAGTRIASHRDYIY